MALESTAVRNEKKNFFLNLFPNTAHAFVYCEKFYDTGVCVIMV